MAKANLSYILKAIVKGNPLSGETKVTINNVVIKGVTSIDEYHTIDSVIINTHHGKITLSGPILGGTVCLDSDSKTTISEFESCGFVDNRFTSFPDLFQSIFGDVFSSKKPQLKEAHLRAEPILREAEFRTDILKPMNEPESKEVFNGHGCIISISALDVTPEAISTAVANQMKAKPATTISPEFAIGGTISKDQLAGAKVNLNGAKMKAPTESKRGYIKDLGIFSKMVMTDIGKAISNQDSHNASMLRKIDAKFTQSEKDCYYTDDIRAALTIFGSVKPAKEELIDHKVNDLNGAIIKVSKAQAANLNSMSYLAKSLIGAKSSIHCGNAIEFRRLDKLFSPNEKHNYYTDDINKAIDLYSCVEVKPAKYLGKTISKAEFIVESAKLLNGSIINSDTKTELSKLIELIDLYT